MGDSNYDMLAAKRAKMYPIGISTEFYSNKRLRKNGAKFVFGKHSEILNSLKSGRIKLVF